MPRRRAEAWVDIIAVMETLPWDSPYARTQPDWQWGDPHRDLLVGILEAAVNANVQRAKGEKAKRDDFLHIPRPGEEPQHQRKLGSTAMSLDALDEWLAGDFEPMAQESHGGQKVVELPTI